MPDKLIDFWTAFAYAVVAISGASGGCLVAAHRAMRGRSITVVMLSAYAFIGCVFAISGVAAMLLFTNFSINLERLVLLGLFFGTTGSVALASANLSIRFILRRLGIEVDVQIKRVEKE